MSVRAQQAQVAAIIGMAERLPDAASREDIAARFGGITGPGARHIDDESVFQSLGTGIHGKRGAYKLLFCYFGATLDTGLFGMI